MNLEKLAETAKNSGVQGVILESHKNWVDNDPIASLKRSAGFMNSHF